MRAKPDYMTTTVTGPQPGPRYKATVSPSFPTGSQSVESKTPHPHMTVLTDTDIVRADNIM